jgi:hypothetical protein
MNAEHPTLSDPQCEIALLASLVRSDPETRVQIVMTVREEDQSPPVEAEEVSQDAPHWTESVDTSDAAPGSVAWDSGALAFKDGKARTDCPCEPGADAVDWLGAYDMAARAAE